MMPTNILSRKSMVAWIRFRGPPCPHQPLHDNIKPKDCQVLLSPLVIFRVSTQFFWGLEIKWWVGKARIPVLGDVEVGISMKTQIFSMQDSGSINSSYTHIPLEIILHPKLYGMILFENDQHLEGSLLKGGENLWWNFSPRPDLDMMHLGAGCGGGWKTFPWMILKMDEQGCRFVPEKHFSEAIRHRWCF